MGKSTVKSLEIMNLKLEEKTALVTGSTAGIGLAIAKSLAAEGARVIVNGRSESRVQQALADIRGTASAPLKLEPLVADLGLTAGATQAIERFPDVDILVNNLGVYAPKPFEQISDADWLAIIETNFMSGVRLSRHYLPRMKQNKWGRILFISSESGVHTPVEMIHYGVTKTPKEWNSSSRTWPPAGALPLRRWRRNFSRRCAPVRCCNASPARRKSRSW
jgi:NAD(P)-dependent dehydrogenase (short-subunit alcohol dehydrogenase family)